MLKVLPPPDVERLRDFFAQANFTDDYFQSMPLLRQLPSRRAGNPPYLLDGTREATPLNVLLRLFFMDVPVEADVFSAVIPAPIQALLLEAGLMTRHNGQIAPEVMLTPYRSQLLAADPVGRMLSSSSDIVLWPNQTSRMLRNFAVPGHSRSTLDLGTGCGVLSVQLAAQSDRVTATDLNPRAAEFVAFNASLNTVDNIRFLLGDTFEPVSSESFDLIVCNPPFFVGPSSDRMYCENSMELDGYCRRIAREASARLNEGGFFQMVCEWVQMRGQSWTERIAEWLDGYGCDAWVARTYIGDPGMYALERTNDEYAHSPESASLKYAEWMDYYRARGVEQIHGGVVAMRRRSGSNWLRFEEVPIASSLEFGSEVQELFATQDVLSAYPTDEQLLAVTPRLVPGARLEQDFAAKGRQWTPESLKVTRGGALPASVPLEFPVAQFVARCDGQQTLAALVEELASLVRAEPSQVRQQCCAVIRKLAGRRLLTLTAP